MTTGLSLTVLGAAGSYAGPGQACSGYLLRSPATTVVLDLGPGTLANLQRHVSIDQVDAVVLSHEHPDHWSDLPVLRNAMRYYLNLEALPVYGTAGTLAKARAVIEELTPTLEWTVIDAAARVNVGDLDLRFSRTDHPVETLAVRVDRAASASEAGRSFAYSADTSPGWRDGGLAEGVDLFLCEATIPTAAEGDGAPHMSARQAGERARANQVGRLVLTHIAPGVDPEAQLREAAAIFDGPVDLAATDATFDG